MTAQVGGYAFKYTREIRKAGYFLQLLDKKPHIDADSSIA